MIQIFAVKAKNACLAVPFYDSAGALNECMEVRGMELGTVVYI